MKLRSARSSLGPASFSVLVLAGAILFAGDAERPRGYFATARTLKPVAIWRLGELHGKVALDEVGHHFGWYRGGVQLGAAGPIQNDTNAAVRFDGKSGFVRIPDDPRLRLDRGTIAFWFYADDVKATQGLVTKDAMGYGDGGHLSLTLRQGQVWARLQSVSESFELHSAHVEQHRWYHVALTFGDAGLRLDLDGKAVAASPYQGGLGASSGGAGNHEPLVVGAGTMHSLAGSEVPLHDFFRGTIDEIAIFEEPLSANQIEGLFAASRPHYASLAEGYALNGPLAWWRLDEIPGALTARELIDAQHGQYHVQGAYFDGDDYVDAGALDVAGEAMTIVARVRVASFSVPDARIVAKATSLAMEDQYWMLGVASREDQSRLRFRLQTESGVRQVVSRAALPIGSSVFVAGVYDGRRLRLYQDGEPIGDFAHHGRIKTNSHVHVWFGDSPAGAGSRPLDGEISEVALFDRALTADQILAISRAETEPAHIAERVDDQPESSAEVAPRVPRAPAEVIAPPVRGRWSPSPLNIGPPAVSPVPLSPTTWPLPPSATCRCPECTQWGGPYGDAPVIFEFPPSWGSYYDQSWP